MNPDERLTRWTTPLAAACADPRQHPAFDAIRAETAKLESPSGGTTDWGEVLRAGDAFLADSGRDLIVASAVASALSHREGVAGITLGAQLLTKLLADATLTPTRVRARANALLAFAARAEIAMDAAKERSRPGLESLVTALAELNGASSALGDEAPSLRGVSDRARAALEALPAPVAPPPVAAPAPVFAPPPPLPTQLPTLTVPAADTLPDRAEHVPAFVRRLTGQLVPAAALLRAASPFDADALRITLVSLYLPITSAPDTTRDARTSLPAPPKLVLETLAKQQHAGAPDSIARDAIAALERGRFALDLHAFLARALDRAGPAALAARDIHRHEVRGLLARLPELLDREFADGTRFASAESRALFASWVAPSVAVEDTADPVAELRAMAREGRTAEALALGTNLRRTAPSGRMRFEATLAMALAAENARALPLAAELHAELLAEMDRHALDAWDPMLVATAIGAAARVATAAIGGESTAKMAFARLARIDARAAFELSSSLHATPSKPGR